MEGRDEKGRFVKGHHSNGGRPNKADRDNLRAIIDAHVSPEAEGAAWDRVRDAMQHGGRGWFDFFKLYLEYRYGKPSQFVDMALSESGDEELTDAERAALDAYLAAESGKESPTHSG